MKASFLARTLVLTACFLATACNGELGPSASRTDVSTDSGRSKVVHKSSPAKTAEATQEEPQVVEEAPLAMQPAAPVVWQLSPADSYLSLITVKQTNIAEVHTFERFNAYVDQDGEAAVAIDLSSIATNVDLRDSRVRDYLFEVGVFPQATVHLKLDMLALDTLAVGEMQNRTLTASLDLHGVVKDVTANVTVLRMSASRITVQTKKPIILNAADFNMSAGIQTLLDLAGLVSISTAVPVEFMLSFDAGTGDAALQ
jgi:polyisoprenoid-binding protein YceI